MLVRPLRPLLAVCAAAVMLTGCGEAVGGETGSVAVSITRDFGTRPVVSAPPVAIRGSTRVLDVLDRVTETREGTARITSIDGISGDWRMFVNGVWTRGAAGADVRPGDRLWLDLPGSPVATPAVVGGFPEPFRHGVAGKRIPTRVECADPDSAACDTVAQRLADLGVVAARGGINAGVNDETIRVVVGTWSDLRGTRDEAVGRVDAGPARSGIFARFDDDARRLHVLDTRGRAADTLADAGLVAATRIDERQPVWFVTGTDEAGVQAAAGVLDEATLTGRYALAVSDDRAVAIPAG